MLKKLINYNISTFLVLLLAFSIAYYLLLIEHSICVSITSIIKLTHNLDLQKHLLIIGLLPIYIAMIIFGTAYAGFYIGQTIQRVLLRAFKS